MGHVLLLSLIESARNPDPIERMLRSSSKLGDHFRYPYRPTLAAKTVKESQAMPLFARECNIWLELEHPGVVPLLKVVDVDGIILALMPQYAGSFRELILRRDISSRDLLRALIEPVVGLAAIYKGHKIVHQDIKPENFLYHVEDGRPVLALSDWGIANVQASQLPKATSELSQIALTTMSGWGTLPYMAPERFYNYISDLRADIFSLGIMMIEVVSGGLPYDSAQPIDQQILSGSYHENARLLLAGLPSRLSSLLLDMIHPVQKNRPGEYDTVLKLLGRV
jgi:serine/threonine-protein kinase